MFNKSILLITMLAAFAANMAFSQKNSIRIQTGLFHCFFDESPILNVNYPHKYSKLDIFNGLILNSNGLAYSRKINEKSQIGVEIQYFNVRYAKFNDGIIITKPVVGWREFVTGGIDYTYYKPINDKFKFNYGGGIYFRSGNETIIISRFPIGDFNGETVYELLVEHVERNDFAINLTTGIEYSPKKWLTLYSKIDLLSFVYVHDKAMAKELKEVYDSPQYPTRFDLSLKFGVGYNF